MFLNLPKCPRGLGVWSSWLTTEVQVWMFGLFGLYPCLQGGVEAGVVTLESSM